MNEANIYANLELMDKIKENENTLLCNIKWNCFLKKYDMEENKYHFFHLKENQNNIKRALSKFYQTHQFITPFVGKNYGHILGENFKVLYVMESHYLPYDSKLYNGYEKNDQNWLLENWYSPKWRDKKGKDIGQEDIEYICTEHVIKANILSNKRFTNLFKKMLRPLYKTLNPELHDSKLWTDDELIEMIEGIAFMNYYLRPSTKRGKQIQNVTIDNCMSYLNLIRVWESLNSPFIVICSSKAANAFETYAKLDNNEINGYYVRCNHPSNQSWNRKDFSSDKRQKDFWDKVLNLQKKQPKKVS